MASIATVVTMGFGSFGSVNLLPTIGYGSLVTSVVSGPFVVMDRGVFTPGIVQSDGFEQATVFVPGARDATVFTPGAVDQEFWS